MASVADVVMANDCSRGKEEFLMDKTLWSSSLFAGTHLYTWVERGTVRVESFCVCGLRCY